MTMRNTMLLFALLSPAYAQDIAVRGDTVYTMAGPAISNGVVVITHGKVVTAGMASVVSIPEGYHVITAKVVTPGLVDAHSVVGLTGYWNTPGDQDQLETSAPIQPELRAVDAYDPGERLVEWVRGFGVTTMNTGHASGALVSGQLMVVKTRGNTVEQATLKPVSMVAASLGELVAGRATARAPVRAPRKSQCCASNSSRHRSTTGKWRRRPPTRIKRKAPQKHQIAI